MNQPPQFPGQPPLPRSVAGTDGSKVLPHWQLPPEKPRSKTPCIVAQMLVVLVLGGLLIFLNNNGVLDGLITRLTHSSTNNDRVSGVNDNSNAASLAPSSNSTIAPCDLLNSNIISNDLGITVSAGHNLSVSGTSSTTGQKTTVPACQFHNSDNTSAVVVTALTGQNQASFATARKKVTGTIGLSGLGDEAFYFPVATGNAQGEALVVRKGETVLEIEAQAETKMIKIDQVKQLALDALKNLSGSSSPNS